MNMMRDLFAEFLRYDSKSGKIFWIKDPALNKHFTGMEAGCVDFYGYRRLKFQGRMYVAHRVCWYLHYGEWPINDIDHRDGNRTNNKIENLRDVSRRQNQSNRASHRAGKLVGATFHRHLKKWQATIRLNGEQKYLGLHATEIQAHNAYRDALGRIKEVK